MNSQPPSKTTWLIYVTSALAAFLIVGGLAWFLYVRTRPAGLNQARIQERLKNLHEINAAAADALTTFAWQDQPKGLVRLPITNAVDLIIREWKNPAQGRSNLLARLDKANPPPPPKEPEKPSVFE